MNHLTEDQIYDLAKAVGNDVPFSDQDVDAIMHIEECENCYRSMKCMMAVMSVTDHMGQFMGKTAPEHQTISAKISLLADRIHSSLDQFSTPGMKWAFVSTAAVSAQKDRDDVVQKHRMEDIDNRQTFVEYEPEKRLLTIQLDGADGDVSVGFLRFEDGTMWKISFEKIGDLYHAQVRDLEDGEYRIILERNSVAESGAAKELARLDTDQIRDLECANKQLLDE